MNLPNYSFLLVVTCFWLAYWVVNRNLVRPLLAVLHEREQRATEGRKAHEQAKATLEQALAQREKELALVAAEAQKERASLRAEGEARRRELLEAAREQGQRRLAVFAAELEQEVAQERAKLAGEVQTLARRLAERLLGRALAA